ncbi:MAG: biopolymer transporter ExbD [Alcaligenaceae bacterium]|nr:biopolymer transporter ExbD [Alcaligenaceae bacterium]
MAFGSMGGSQDQSEMAEINVTPLVDVMLVLLIVFMITMPVFTSSIQVQLPKSSHKEIKEMPHIVRVTIDANATYYINDKPLSEDELKTHLETLYREHSDAVIAIHADENVQYGAVATLLDMSRQIGLVKVGFETEFKEKK